MSYLAASHTLDEVVRPVLGGFSYGGKCHTEQPLGLGWTENGEPCAEVSSGKKSKHRVGTAIRRLTEDFLKIFK